MGPVRSRTALLAPLFLLALAACDPVEPGEDGGGVDAGRLDGSSARCERASDCDDGLYCNGAEVCFPGDPGADARGCVAGDAPCSEGETCEEEGPACVPDTCETPDEDSDGHDRLACGGDDCDDDNGERYPGNPEVCDDVDQDCGPTTFGDTDADGDGAISASCCNGDVCGSDCDDTRSDVNPGAVESCNAVDDDCSGVIDDQGELALCPGGTCRSGRCDFSAWDRVFGVVDDTETHPDRLVGVGVDGESNVYVAGTVAGTVDFGGGPQPSTAPEPIPEDYVEGFVASYTAAGVFRWARRLGTLAPAQFNSVTISSVAVADDRVYIGGRAGEFNFGAGPQASGTFVAALTVAGDTLWTQTLPVAPAPLQIAAAGSELRVFSHAWFPPEGWDFGGGLRTVADAGLVLLALASDGTYAWDLVTQTQSNAVRPMSVDVDETGRTVAVGSSFQELTLGAFSTGPGQGFVLNVSSSGDVRWFRGVSLGSDGGGTLPQAVAIGVSGVVVGGTAFDQADVGGGPGPAGGFLVQLSESGVFQWEARFPTIGGGIRGSVSITSVAVDAAQNVAAGGFFEGDVDLGSGTRALPAGEPAQAFVLSRQPDGLHRFDRVFGSANTRGLAFGRGDSLVAAGSFSGTTDLGSGPRLGRGARSLFLTRLPY